VRRFTETQKWDDPWFRGLAGAHKLVFLYIIDRCDNAGFWEIDMESVRFHTKLEERHLEGALKGLERGIVERDGWCWVKKFLKHQKNENLNPANPAHRQIIGFLVDQLPRFKEVKPLIPKGASKGLPSPIGIGIGKGNSKEEGEEEAQVAGIRPQWRSLSVEKQKTQLLDANTDEMNLVGSILGRRKSTRWTVAEALKLESIQPDPESIELLRRYYNVEMPKGEDFRRRTIETLLNHWNGEIDKATIYLIDNP
jgi:hypothetical protein